jgi:hypothetical protein
MEKYNGWTNYETWRVNIEMVDGFWGEIIKGNQKPEAHKLALDIKDSCETWIEESAPEGLARDYALAFLSTVNWREIAQRLIDGYCIEDNSASALCRCGKPDSACDC